MRSVSCKNEKHEGLTSNCGDSFIERKGALSSTCINHVSSTTVEGLACAQYPTTRDAKAAAGDISGRQVEVSDAGADARD